jgi:hypothetical protein
MRRAGSRLAATVVLLVIVAVSAGYVIHLVR